MCRWSLYACRKRHLGRCGHIFGSRRNVGDTRSGWRCWNQKSSRRGSSRATMRGRCRLRKSEQILGLACCAACLVATSGANLVATEMGHAAHSGGPVPREILDRPVTLRTGIGAVHEKVSTSSTEAQAFYDQGLAYLHSFVWIEAIRSFHQALRNDGNLGMAYLGLAD